MEIKRYNKNKKRVLYPNVIITPIHMNESVENMYNHVTKSIG